MAGATVTFAAANDHNISSLISISSLIGSYYRLIPSSVRLLLSFFITTQIFQPPNDNADKGTSFFCGAAAIRI